MHCKGCRPLPKLQVLAVLPTSELGQAWQWQRTAATRRGKERGVEAREPPQALAGGRTGWDLGYLRPTTPK